ncbi:DsbA family protein [Xanthobacteraceae bacterium Astr-EGSB]|uniref:DsbA family protein n=1 Tax=Astrobacterium formosum TaxID=3069710 RepID=UPI0027B4050B|nr:DsbA family protein [Xanthobacteraceae bacterium Astr-EGSB]
MHRRAHAFLLAALLPSIVFVATVLVHAAPIATPPKPLLPDAAFGRDGAPVTVVEYSSLGCSHCAAFHAEVLPRIKQAYVDTGKVRWVVRDFPLGQLPLAGAVVARCAGPNGYLALIDILFRTQERWMLEKDPIGELERLVRQSGMGKERFNACLADRALIDGVMNHAQAVQKAKLVSATPTFMIDDEQVVGMTSFEEFAKTLDRHLAAAPPKPRP